MKKTILSTAIITILGVSPSVKAVTLTNMSIEDWDGGGVSGAFAFAPGTSATSKYTNFFDSTSFVLGGFGATYHTSGNGIITNGVEQSSAAADTSINDSFTAGFAFNGYGFALNSLAATGSGLDFVLGDGGIQAGEVNTGDTSLDFTSEGTKFTWSGIYGLAEMFPLSPDNGFSTNILTQGGVCSAAIGSNQACYILRWEHFIHPQSIFTGDTVWQLEGIATFDANVDLSAVPVPAAVWLFGSGVVGLVGLARRRRKA